MDPAYAEHALKWGLLIRGIIAIFFGVVAVGWPGLTLLTLATAFAIYLVLHGIVDLISGIMTIEADRYWILKVLIGIFWVGTGVYLFKRQDITLTVFILLLGLTLIARGVFEVVLAFGRELATSFRALLVITGLVTATAGFIILKYPVKGTLAFVWVLGLYALITGPLLIALSLMIPSAKPDRRSR
jgi:uncharacterized membrane protein HdeD (DUF308 family)